MEETKKVNYWLCTIDLENEQQDYSKCLQLILWLESLKDINAERQIQEPLSPTEFQEFSISRIGIEGICNKKSLLEQENIILAGESKRYKQISSAKSLLEGLKKDSNKNNFSYYIRVHVDDKESDLAELQYLILLLRAVPGIIGKVAIRLMERQKETWETRQYFRVSHFLRFIQQRYHCFYACFDKQIHTLMPLSQKADGVQSTFLPLLEVNGQLCQVLNRTWILEGTYQNQRFDKLYEAFNVSGHMQETYTYDLFQIGLNMLFKNMSGQKYRTEKSKKELIQFLCDLVQEIQGITALDLLLFGALAGDILGKGLKHDEVKDCMGKVQMLSTALGQILENIVNHSERNQGVFTFRLQSNLSYMNSHYPGYYPAEKKTYLELLVADSNQNDGIVEHFLNSNKADSTIKNLRDRIELQQLFGCYPDSGLQQIWQSARNKHPEMCHGLLSFMGIIQKLNGAIRVRSTPEFRSRTLKNLYYYNGDDKQQDIQKMLTGRYIPGTQFSIAVKLPIVVKGDTSCSKENEEWAFDFDKLVYATTYLELAQALTFDEDVYVLNMHDCFKQSVIYPHNQEEKDLAATYWKNWFNNRVNMTYGNSRKVYQCDLDELCQILVEHPECGEPFCKGFLSSRFFEQPKVKRYFCVIMQNPSALFSRIFAGTVQAEKEYSKIDSDYTCVYFYPKRYKGDYLPYCATTLWDLLQKSWNDAVFPRVFPYMLFLKEEGKTFFEKELLNQANTSIMDKTHQGFKLAQTHMRLGNKVHLDTFYEMALFFENPNCAYYTAFLFLRNFLREGESILQKNKKLLFYGYASYSRAIIWATIRILEQYSKIKNYKEREIAFLIYQNDLKLQSDQPQTQMYYSREEWQRDSHTIWEPQDTALMLIVPISSSLTTFNKMIAELNRETNKNFCAIEYFTAFWVRNHYIDETQPSDIEKNFWKKVDPQKRVIESDLVQGKIRYLISAISEWSNPLTCSKCFPEDPIWEYPLVETDPTSTVPTQQFYCEKDFTKKEIEDTKEEQENDERVSRLKDNIIYGHVLKGDNHYQYYVKTRLYFQQERNGIEKWLKDLRLLAEKEKDPSIVNPSLINVLVIPQQTDNVEFGQYVYEYYFQGCAECMIINTEKEYRSNLKAEYSGLFQRLSMVAEPEKNIRFHYIDISIRSGNSYNRAVSLIASCMSSLNTIKEGKEAKKDYQFRFEKIFLLISRLSQASKQTYIQGHEKNFHVYAEIHISAMRTFGDSCVPCKVQQEAENYYRKAATKSISSYWEEKTYTRACVPFDKLEETKQDVPETQDEGYRRMMCAHRAAHYIRPVQGAEVGSYFLAIRGFLDEIRTANQKSLTKNKIYAEINEQNRQDWLSAGLKVIARPFFSFDYKIRCAVMDLYLLLAEMLIKKCDLNTLQKRLKCGDVGIEKAYLLKEGNLEWINTFAESLLVALDNDKIQQLEFIRSHILKGLVDIKSNYILRKDTIIKVANCVSKVYEKEEEQKEFYKHYLRSVLRLTHGSSDETKGVWLEYLLQYGKEYSGKMQDEENRDGIKLLVTEVPERVKHAFQNFLELLLVENNRPIYQSVIEYDKKRKEEEGKRTSANIISAVEFLKEYHMRNAASFWSFGYGMKEVEQQLRALRELLSQLEGKGGVAIDGGNVTDRYMHLGQKIQEIFETETVSKEHIIVFGKSDGETDSCIEEYLDLPNYFVLYPSHFSDENQREKGEQQKIFEERWGKIQKNTIACKELEENGFYLFEICEQTGTYDVLIKLDNNYDYLIQKFQKKILGQEIVVSKIEPLYIYFPCELCRQKTLGLTRKILMFRRKLVEWLETDFNNNAIAILSRQQNLSKILSTDKMGDHADTIFVECQEELLLATHEKEFQEKNQNGDWQYEIGSNGKMQKIYEVSEGIKSPLEETLGKAREWFLLRSYVNARISRMFRTMVRTEDALGKEKAIDPDVYYICTEQRRVMYFAHDLQVLFFTPVNIGYSRENYLYQMMQTVYFTVHGVPDYRDKPDADISMRLKNLSEQLKEFQCIQVTKDGIRYAYLSEYLTIVLLDCFVSGLKVGEIWNRKHWGGEAFQVLNNSIAEEKCRIDLAREKGGEYGGVEYDYLVIHNAIYHKLSSEKKGRGMSLAAIRWYIEGFWCTCVEGNGEYPRVCTNKESFDYTIKLPILTGRRDYCE